MTGRDEYYQEAAKMVGAKRGLRKPVEIRALLRGHQWAWPRGFAA